MSEGKKGSEKEDYIKWFSDISKNDVATCGGKGANLGEMYNIKFPVPPGFVVTAQAYAYFIEVTGIKEKMHSFLKGLDVNNTEELNAASKKIRKLMEETALPKDLAEEIVEAYDILDADGANISNARGGAIGILKTGHEPPFVAVRSSATAEDLADASFAGQQESFLNVKGKQDLLKYVRMCFSSLFTPRAIYYRTKKGFEHEKTYLAAVVQKMAQADKSGVMFSKNPIKDDGSIMIEAGFGLGEGIVSGMVNPDTYVVDGNLDEFKIIQTIIGDKKKAVVRDSAGRTKIVALTAQKSKQQVLTNYEIKRLAQYAMMSEEHYQKPQDMEWAIESGEIYIVQSRPITTKVRTEKTEEVVGKVLLSGLSASPGIGSGPVKIIHDLSELEKVKKGDVLVTEMTNPDMVVSMEKAAAIVTDEGGITSHAAIVSREMGIPCVVGTGNATTKLKDGEIITVDGGAGKVVEGRGDTKKIEIEPIVLTRTKIKVIVDLPNVAHRAALSKAKAVGLVRLEGIIAEFGKHPLKFVKDGNMKPYIKALYEGLSKISEPFEEVWVRSSDLRSDEFRGIEGAPQEHEENPMLGDHGIRFSLRYPEIVKAEFTAIKEVADDNPKKIMGLFAPQIISVSELKEMKRIAKEEVGIPKNVKIGIMVETPAAVQTIEDFCKEGMDFISFGTNDLTQFTLAIDRNNQNVQYLFNELHPAVINSIRSVIRCCKKYGVETSICGQAASKPEMAMVLVKEGIDSLSVNADAARKVSEVVAQVEAELSGQTEKDHVQVIIEPEMAGIGAIKESDKKDVAVLYTPVMMNQATPVLMNEVVAEVKEAERPATHSLAEQAAAPMPVIQETNTAANEDIEQVVLRELGDEYRPGSEPSKDIPKLNDAIPVSSEHLNEHLDEKKEEKEVNLSKEKKDTKVNIF